MDLVEDAHGASGQRGEDASKRLGEDVGGADGEIGEDGG
jgi:hypothetical protein